MSNPSILALDVTEAARAVWGKSCPQRVALSAGTAAILQGEADKLDPAALAGALAELHPDRWVPGLVAGTFVTRSFKGRSFAGWHAEGGTLLGLLLEINMGLSVGARVQVLVPGENVARLMQ